MRPTRLWRFKTTQSHRKNNIMPSLILFALLATATLATPTNDSSRNSAVYFHKCAYHSNPKYGNFSVQCRGTRADFLWHLRAPIENFRVYVNISARAPQQADLTSLIQTHIDYCDLIRTKSAYPIINVMYDMVRSGPNSKMVDSCPIEPVRNMQSYGFWIVE